MTDLRYRGAENKGDSVKHDDETDDLVYRGSHHDPSKAEKEPKHETDETLVYRGKSKS